MSIPDIEAAIYSVLSADGTVTGLVGTNIADTFVPQSFTRPYLVISQIAGGNTNISGLDDVNVIFQITAVAESNSSAKQAIEAAHDALHKVELSITGWSNYRTVAEDYQHRVDTYDGEQYFMRSFRLRVEADEEP